MRSLFSSSKLAFQPVDPMGDGLGDDIANEQSQAEVTAFQQDLDGQNLIGFWDKVEDDIHKDPEWIDFSKD